METIMGRPPLRKKGAFTPAERQRRRRKRLAAERRAAEVAAQREANRAKYRARNLANPISYCPGEPAVREQLPPATPQDIADELVAQLDDVIASGDTTLNDIVAAFRRRFGDL
jgi:hypothetical protein